MFIKVTILDAPMIKNQLLNGCQCQMTFKKTAFILKCSVGILLLILIARQGVFQTIFKTEAKIITIFSSYSVNNTDEFHNLKYTDNAILNNSKIAKDSYSKVKKIEQQTKQKTNNTTTRIVQAKPTSIPQLLRNFTSNSTTTKRKFIGKQKTKKVKSKTKTPKPAPAMDPKLLLQNPNSTNLCPEKPPHLIGNDFTVEQQLNDTWKDLQNSAKFTGVQNGSWKPSECESRQSVAIIVPYRKRLQHLRIFLYNIHPFLQRQQLFYRIFLVNQTDQLPFNRGLLFNIGFREVRKVMNATCFIFHDVDLLPENDYNLYRCGLQPRHMSVAVDKFKYKLPYPSIFGGIVAIAPDQFLRINGFSNEFWGWGGEDDDLGNRRYWAGYSILRYSTNIARYKMIKHSKEKGNLPNPKRFKLINKGQSAWKKVGVNSSRYSVVSWFYHKLYTTINVHVNATQV